MELRSLKRRLKKSRDTLVPSGNILVLWPSLSEDDVYIVPAGLAEAGCTLSVGEFVTGR